MDDATDRALYKIERKIRNNRDPKPCDDYERTSNLLPQCVNCGWCHEE